MKRQRGRSRKPGGGHNQNSANPNRSWDSQGPENIKVRGNAQTVYERYQQLARDAASAGDRVLAENYTQHAEHYFRVLRALQPQRSFQEIAARETYSQGFDIDFEDESGAQAAAFLAAQQAADRAAQQAGHGHNQGQNQGQTQGQGQNGGDGEFRQARDGEDRQEGEGGRRESRRDRWERKREERGRRPDRDGDAPRSEGRDETTAGDDTRSADDNTAVQSREPREPRARRPREGGGDRDDTSTDMGLPGFLTRSSAPVESSPTAEPEAQDEAPVRRRAPRRKAAASTDDAD